MVDAAFEELESKTKQKNKDQRQRHFQTDVVSSVGSQRRNARLPAASHGEESDAPKRDISSETGRVRILFKHVPGGLTGVIDEENERREVTRMCVV